MTKDEVGLRPDQILAQRAATYCRKYNMGIRQAQEAVLQDDEVLARQWYHGAAYRAELADLALGRQDEREKAEEAALRDAARLFYASGRGAQPRRRAGYFQAGDSD